jgi:hypothetical protein
MQLSKALVSNLSTTKTKQKKTQKQKSIKKKGYKSRHFRPQMLDLAYATLEPAVG